MRFESVPLKNGLIGGHWAVKDTKTDRVIGRSFRLDKVQADVLRFELEGVSNEVEKTD